MVKSFLLRQKRRIDLWSAHIEAYLTTRSFLLLFLIGYVFLIGLFFFWGFYKQWKGVPDLQIFTDEEKKVLRYPISIARGGGFVLNITTALVIFLAAKLLFTVLRETPLQLVLPLDKGFPFFHVVVGYTIVAAVLIHGTFHLVWIIRWNGWNWGVFGFTMSVITGFLLLIDFSIMLIFARKKERREHFRRFYVVHITGALIFFSLLFIHGMFLEEPETYKWILGPVIIYLVDRGIRYFRTQSSKVTISNDGFILKGQGIVSLKFPKQFSYRAGQYAELMIPDINREWHPFTIASAPHEEEMHFFIKAVGDWTTALQDLLQKRLNSPDASQEPLTIFVMGPYGAPAQHVRSYHRVILVSGGVGSTPFSSICKHLHHLQVTKKRSVFEDSRTDTAALHNVNRRLLQKLAELYDMDLEQLCSSVDEEDVWFKGQHLVNMANMLAPANLDLANRDENSSPEESTEISGDGNLNPNVPDDESSLPMEPVQEQNRHSSTQSASSHPHPPSAYDDMEAGLLRQVGSVFYDIAGQDMAKRKSRMPQVTARSVEKLHEEQKQNRTFKGRLKALYGMRAMLLAFAHTTRVVFLMLVSLLVRGTLICIGMILGSVSLSTGVSYEEAAWLITADTVLGIMLALQVTGTVILEISYMGKRFFNSRARVLDLVVLVPLVILSNAYGIRAWIGDNNVASWYIIVHFFVLLPVLFTLLGYRLYRSVGSHTLLRDAPAAGRYKTVVPAVDFMWTTPRDDDDKWLREELNPLATGSDELRLHRFVTRAEKDELKKEEEYISSTRAGRPQWDELLRQVTLETPSNKEVGVFFCGPKPMGNALEKSLRKIEVLSNLRAAYLNATPRTQLIADMQLRSARTLDLLLSTGCNIRFVYREENFGY